LFQPFAMTVTIAMLASLVVALAVVPVLAYWFVREPRGPSGDSPTVQRAAGVAQDRRGRWQRESVPARAAALRGPGAGIGLAGLGLAGTVALTPRLETNFIGDSGQNTVTITQTSPAGTTLEAQDAGARQVEEVLADLAEV